MSQHSESDMPRTGQFTAEPSTTDVVHDEAADVAQHARQAGGQVTQTAADQTWQVAAETGRQARGLLGEAQGQVRDQASAQQQKAAGQLRSVADELAQMADKGGQSCLATNVARQAADRLHGAAAWLEKRQPTDLLDEVRNFARRRPGVFLLGAATAGLAAGRITRGLTPKNDEQQDADGGTAPGVPAADTADFGGVADTDFPTETGPAGLDEPFYLAEPGVGAGVGYRAGTDPIDAATAVYPADPLASPEPGWAPGAEGSR
jgi:hypothetical protein